MKNKITLKIAIFCLLNAFLTAGCSVKIKKYQEVFSVPTHRLKMDANSIDKKLISKTVIEASLKDAKSDNVNLSLFKVVFDEKLKMNLYIFDVVGVDDDYWVYAVDASDGNKILFKFEYFPN